MATLKKLNEIAKNRNEALLGNLSSFSFMKDYVDNFSVYDHYVVSTKGFFSPIVDAKSDTDSLVEFRANVFSMISAKKISYTDMYNALIAEYNPLHNYDRIENYTDVHTGNETTTLKYDDVNRTIVNGSENVVNSSDGYTDTSSSGIAGFNSSSYNDSNKTTDVFGNKKDTMTKDAVTNTELTKGRSDSNDRVLNLKDTHTASLKGNIGVTTSQQMLESEIDLREKYSFFDIVVNDIIETLCSFYDSGYEAFSPVFPCFCVPVENVYNVNVTDNYYDGDTLIRTVNRFSASYSRGESYSFSPLSIEDYHTDDSTVKGIVLDDVDIAFNYYYTANSFEYKVVDEYYNTYGSLVQSVTRIDEQKKYGDTYTATPLSPEGYTTEDVPVSGTITKNTTVTFRYNEISKFNFTCIDVYVKGATRTETTRFSREVESGYEYSVSPLTIPGTTTEGTVKSGTVMQNTTVTFTYNYIPYTVSATIQKYYDTTKELLDFTETIDQTIDYFYGDTYSVSSSMFDIPNYTVFGTESYTGTITGDVNVVFTYARNEYTLTVDASYYDGDTLERTETISTQKVKYNDTYSINGTSVSGYTLSNPTISGTMTEDTTITFKYTKVAGNTYILTVVDKYYVNDVLYSEPVRSTTQYPEGTDVVIYSDESNKPSDLNYSWFVDNYSLSATMNQDTTMEFRYDAKVYLTITDIYTSSDGSNVYKEVERTRDYYDPNSPYTASPLSTDHYTTESTSVSGTITEDTQVSFTYKANADFITANVTVRDIYYDVDTGSFVPTVRENISGTLGTSTTIAPKSYIEVNSVKYYYSGNTKVSPEYTFYDDANLDFYYSSFGSGQANTLDEFLLKLTYDPSITVASTYSNAIKSDYSLIGSYVLLEYMRQKYNEGKIPFMFFRYDCYDNADRIVPAGNVGTGAYGFWASAIFATDSGDTVNKPITVNITDANGVSHTISGSVDDITENTIYPIPISNPWLNKVNEELSWKQAYGFAPFGEYKESGPSNWNNNPDGIRYTVYTIGIVNDSKGGYYLTARYIKNIPATTVYWSQYTSQTTTDDLYPANPVRLDYETTWDIQRIY